MLLGTYGSVLSHGLIQFNSRYTQDEKNGSRGGTYHLPLPSYHGKLFGHVLYDIIAPLKTSCVRSATMIPLCLQLSSS